jgi:anaerobic selenocysteine-containing dehydrogenase
MRRTKLGQVEQENFVRLSAMGAEKLGINDGEQVRVRTYRAELVVKAKAYGIAEEVAWMPFHFAEAPTNRLTHDALDPVCGITELKVCAAGVEPI